MEEFLVGGIAGLGSSLLTNPIDVVKTRMQLQGEMRSHHQFLQERHFRNMPHAAYIIIKEEGWKSMARGTVPNCLYGFILNGIRLGLFKMADLRGWTKNENGKKSAIKEFALSFGFGASGGWLANPLLLLKTRNMASAQGGKLAAGKQHNYLSFRDAIRTIWSREGIRGFYAGAQGATIRMGFGSAFQLTTFLQCKQALLNRGYLTNSPVTLAFTASCVSGLVNAVAVTPLDTATVRLHNQGQPSKGQKRMYEGLFDSMKKIYLTEGIHGLYKGFGPLYFRMAPQTTISLVIWDVVHNFIDKTNELKNKK